MAADSAIRIVIADEAVRNLKRLSDYFGASSDIGVAAATSDLNETAERALKVRADVVVLGLEKRDINVARIAERLAAQGQTSVVVYSTSLEICNNAARIKNVECVLLNIFNDDAAFNRFAGNLAGKIRAAAPHRREGAPQATHFAAQQSAAPLPLLHTRFSGVIAVGASTGGTEAVSKIMRRLPADMPPIVIVQHMPPGFTKIFAERLDRECAFDVEEAEDNQPLRRGMAYVAPGGYQMRLYKSGAQTLVRVRAGEKVSGHCPSVDVMFESVAEVMGGNAVGILLTGMGADGARGLLAMRRKGAYTIGQDEASSVVYGMPGVAFSMGAVMQQAALEDVGMTLINYLNKH